MDALTVVEDEVALEGLDGITIPSLWIRLSKRKQPFPLKLDDLTKGFIWRYLVSNTELKFYELPEERDDVVLFERFKYEVVKGEKKEIYPLNIIVNNKDGLRGSCSTFNERKDVTHEVRSKSRSPLLSLNEATERYGRKLVVVASQSVRLQALYGPETDPDVKLSDECYCILERVGRGRWQGDVQSEMHGSWFKLDARKFHYLRKPLIRHKLVVMQSYLIRQVVGQHKFSILLLLKRFHVNRRSKYDVLAERASNLLSQMPLQFSTFAHLRQHLRINERTLKRVLVDLKEAKCVQNCRLPLEDLDGEGEPCLTKKGNKVMVRGVKLLKPYQSKCAAADEEEDDDEDDDEDVGGKKGIVPAVGRFMEMDLISQSYYYILSCGTKGIPKSHVAAKMNIGKLESRMICRRLEKDGLIKGFMEDMGRQRTTKYISHTCVGGSDHLQQFAKEQERQKLLCSDIHSANTSPEVTKKQGRKSEKSPAAKKHRKTTKKEPVSDDVEFSKKTIKRKTNKEHDPEGQESGQPTPGEREATSTNHSEQNQAESISGLPASEMAVESPNPAGDVVTNVLDSFSENLSKAAVKSQDKSRETYRVLRRKNLIIEAIQTLKVVEGMFPLQKIVNEAERLDGCNTTCCKKTITRLVLNLVREGLLKIYSTTVIQDGIAKKIDMIVHPSIQQDDQLVLSVIEQVRFRISGVSAARTTQEEEEGRDKDYSEMTGCVFKSQKCMGLKKQERIKEEKFKPTRVPGMGRSLGFQPKMHRLHVVHAFLWYVIYGQKAEPESNPEESQSENESLEKPLSNSLELETSDAAALDSAPAGHSEPQDKLAASPRENNGEEEVSWQKFIPPLRQHKGYSCGWAMISDLLLCMPLSIFVQIIQINYTVDGLEDYMNDPVKQHHLVRALPFQMRRKLLFRRKYIFSFHENLQKLTYMGLVQFGPNGKFHDKDHVFIYLKRNATIVDTTSSEPHYWLVSESPEKPFEKRHYQFNTYRDVENFWFDLMCVCLNTPLGVVRHQRGENETTPSFYNDRSVFVGMAHLLKGSPDVCDDASTPGDGRGAAGLDSEFFSHLKRNWLWTNHLMSDKKSTDSTQVQTKIRLKSLMSKNILHIASRAGNFTNPYYVTPKKCVVRGEDVEVVTEPASRNKQVVGGKNQKRKRAKKESVNPPRKKIKESKKHSRTHDEVDHKALKMMTRQRVIWKIQEDSVLLLGNVASHLLNSKLKKPFIWYYVLRDMLHVELTCSLDKTSQAVGRRSRYILKNPQTLLNYRICLAEVKQDKTMMQQLEENLPADPNNSEDCAKAFAEYIKLLRLKFSSFNSSCPLDTSFDTKEQLFSRFRVCTIENKSKTSVKESINSTADIQAIVLQNLIQSTLSINNFQMRSLRSFQTFHMYSQYNQELLCQVFLQCRKKGLVNRRRVGKLQGGGPKKNRALPILPMSYQLSQTYYRTFSWRFPHSLCTDSFRFFKGLSKHGANDYRPKLSFYHETDLRTQDVEVMQKKEDASNKLAEGGDVNGGEEAGNLDKAETERNTVAGDAAPVGKQDDSRAGAEQGGLEPSDMFLYSMDSLGGSCLAALSLMSLGWLSLHLSVPKQMVVVDSQLVDKDVVKSMNVQEDDDEDDRDECGKKMEVKAHQASHTKYLMMQGYCIPGIVKNRNLNTSDSIVVESCIIRLQLRNTQCHQVFPQDDFHPLSFSKTGPSLLPSSLTRFVHFTNCPSTEEWGQKLVEKGYTAQDMEESSQLRLKLDGAGEKGMDEEELVHNHTHLLELQGGRSRTLYQYMEDLQEDGLVLKVGGLCYRWVLMEHAEPWLLSLPPNKWQPQDQALPKTRLPRKRSRREAAVKPDGVAPKRFASGGGESPVPSIASAAPTITEQQGDPTFTGEDQENRSESVGDGEKPEEKEAGPVKGEESHEREGSHEEENAEEKASRRTRPEAAAADSDESVTRFIGRPWRMTDGKLNRPVCKGMLEGVMQHIMTYPGVTLQTLLEHYKRVAQPVVLMELLQALVEMGCVTRKTMVKKPKPSLFSRSLDTSQHRVGLEIPDSVFYEPTISCCLRLGPVFPNERDWSFVTQ